MLKTKRQITLVKFLLIFSLGLSTCSSYAYLAQVRNMFLQTGKCIVSLSKHAKSKIFSLSKKRRAPIENLLNRDLTMKQKKTLFLIIMSLYLLSVFSILIRDMIGSAYSDYRGAYRDIVDPNRNEYQKLRAARGYRGLTKAVLENFNDVNVHFNANNENHRTPLHFVVEKSHQRPYYTRNTSLNLARWLIEEKFANVQAIDNNARTPRISITQLAAPLWLANYYAPISQYLEEKENQQQDLITLVNFLQTSLENHGDNNNNEILKLSKKYGKSRVLKVIFENIATLIKDKTVPGYAKMLVLPKLVQLWKDHGNICSLNDIESFYQYIVFNRPFLEQPQFRTAIDFVQKQRHNILDMNGKTLFEAQAEHGTKNTFEQAVSNALETKGELYNNNNVLKNWLAEQPTPVEQSEPDRNRTMTEQYEQALRTAKRKNNKKRFRELLNPLLVKRELRKIKIPSKAKKESQQLLPNELVGRIMGYAGTDFGDKLLVTQEQ